MSRAKIFAALSRKGFSNENRAKGFQQAKGRMNIPNVGNKINNANRIIEKDF